MKNDNINKLACVTDFIKLMLLNSFFKKGVFILLYSLIFALLYNNLITVAIENSYDKSQFTIAYILTWLLGSIYYVFKSKEHPFASIIYYTFIILVLDFAVLPIVLEETGILQKEYLNVIFILQPIILIIYFIELFVEINLLKDLFKWIKYSLLKRPKLILKK